MEPQQVNAERQLLQIIDVRPREQFDAAHIDGAHNIPLEELRDRTGELNADRTIITVSGDGTDSERAVEVLRDEGYDAKSMTGGIVAWTGADLPVAETDPSVQPD